MQVANASPVGRYHNLDALRAGALLLGVLAHATISFFPNPGWVADDITTSPTLLIANFVQHIFRMSLFFTIAGFFAHLLLERRGMRGFIGNRLKRIALVFIVFWPLMSALLVAVALWSAQYAGTEPLFGGDVPPVPTPETAPPPRPPLWRILPLGHTWFLYMLTLLYAGTLGCVGLFNIIDQAGRVAAIVDVALKALARSHALPGVLAAPLFLVFLLHTSWLRTAGIQTPDFGLVPAMSAVVGFATAFVFGWFLRRQPDLLQIWQRSWPVYASIALLLTIYCGQLMSAASSDPASLPTGAIADMQIAAAYPLAVWTWCLALLGAATRILSAENQTIRYLSDASYWVYLIHLPLIVALQVLVSPWNLPWQIKYLLIIVLALPLLFGSYHVLVRRTRLGAWLNGRRVARRQEGTRRVDATAE